MLINSVMLLWIGHALLLIQAFSSDYCLLTAVGYPQLFCPNNPHGLKTRIRIKMIKP